MNNNHKFIERHGFQGSRSEFRDSSFMKLNQVRPHVKITPQIYENGGKNLNFLKVRSKK